ncbi:hypothetical protein BU25DRAFT_472135 [Macroventuria anomochaeta]|uniref:Uncharacterized protein n=1 Tax=Macroventuria anomochaeta TaxID=301207 RepID=A0ACB6RXG0_9PLEO|nr:uncharacterized protein BU25DRAFT_472135 [Macroventuria anomochaeta]KAF2626413.1 hypothetical protein BU25DRAFT_472135 [Macroventuria anomochaeta]
MNPLPFFHYHHSNVVLSNAVASREIIVIPTRTFLPARQFLLRASASGNDRSGIEVAVDPFVDAVNRSYVDTCLREAGEGFPDHRHVIGSLYRASAHLQHNREPPSLDNTPCPFATTREIVEIGSYVAGRPSASGKILTPSQVLLKASSHPVFSGQKQPAPPTQAFTKLPLLAMSDSIDLEKRTNISECANALGKQAACSSVFRHRRISANTCE